MNDLETTLEMNKIKEKLFEFAYTEEAKDRIIKLVPFLSELEVIAAQRETTEAKLLMEKLGNPPLTSFDNIEEYLLIAEKGGCLTAEQLERITFVITAVRRLKDYLKRGRQLEIGIAFYEENLDSLDDVRDEIGRMIRGGRVDDYATKELKSIRAEIDTLESKMRDKAEAILRGNKDSMSEQFSTTRNGRICLPVKKECKFKISGSVIDKSSTGNTLFIEPTVVAKYGEDLGLKRIDEENEVRKILYTLTALVGDSTAIFMQNKTTIEKLDFMFSKGKLSMELQGIQPVINTTRRIKMMNARHPLMDRKICVPLSIDMGGDIQGIVITGPNTGGKTVAIKTVGINCYMAQCGLHVSCESADLCMNNRILCDIGDGQNISENLSTFSAHITNILDILKKADKESLVILDELGSGTDPTEGMGIAIAILEELKKSGALYLATTHYPEVKNYAEQTERLVNARMTFDRESLNPLYQLEIGKAGESCALYIAKKLGMPGNMLRCASKAAYGTDQSEFIDADTKDELIHERNARIKKRKVNKNNQEQADKFKLGDSVMVLPDKKVGIICQTANEKGVLRIQLQDKKIWINHKRIKLLVASNELYPEDYDYSIIFDSVENRKARHQMDRKHDPDVAIYLSKEEQ